MKAIDPLIQSMSDCKMAQKQIIRLRKEIAIYRKALEEIRQLTPFGSVSEKAKYSYGTFSSIGIEAYKALNWAEFETEDYT